jgi:sugar phosphate isomerase/epimerase
MKFAICNEMFEGWTQPDVFRFAAGLGYEGVEIAPFTLAESIEQLSGSERAQLRQDAEKCGIEIVGLHWLLASPAGLHIAHPDGSVRQRTAAYLKELVGCCADLGGKVMVFGSPKQRNVLPELSPEQARDLAVKTFREVLPATEGEDVTICLEPLTSAETDFVNTAAEAVEIIDEIAHPNLRLHLDVKAMCAESEPIPAIIKGYAPYMRHFHVNDPNLRGPGFGELDFAPIMAALKEVGYDGYVSVEVFDFSPDPETIASKSIEYLKTFS